MKKFVYVPIICLLTSITLCLRSCKQMLDLSVGDWYGTEEVYILDEEGDAVRFYVNLHLILGDKWDYKMDITFSGIAAHEETAHYHSYSYSGTWSRDRASIKLSDYGELVIKEFTDKKMVLESKWPFDGRPASELELKGKEREEAMKQNTTITVNKTN